MSEADLNIKQRRDKQRLPFKRQVQLHSPSAGSLTVDGVNYSPGGMAVQSFRQLPVGEQVKLSFPVDQNQAGEMEVTGEVVHNTLQGSGFMIGIRFLERIEVSLDSDS